MRVVGRDEDRLRAQRTRSRCRDRGEDAELARLVAGGGYDGARAGARHDHRQPAQLGPALQFHRYVEGVHVHMGDALLH
jgi:hypothetical protein